METKWTPGPWAFKSIGGSYDYISALDETVCVCEFANPVMAGDAHLIAAAPELYEALCEFVFDFQKLKLTEEERFDKARAALAKARGE